MPLNKRPGQWRLVPVLYSQLASPPSTAQEMRDNHSRVGYAPSKQASCVGLCRAACSSTCCSHRQAALEYKVMRASWVLHLNNNTSVPLLSCGHKTITHPTSVA
jgi:hypothetical protein